MNSYDDALAPQAPTLSPAPANEYDDMLTSMDAQKKAQLQQPFVQTADQSPDQAAEDHKLSQTTEIPVTIVSRNREDVRKRAAADATPYEGMLRDTPTLAEYITQHPTIAPVVKDDLPQLGALDFLLGLPGKAGEHYVTNKTVENLTYQSIFRSLSTDEQATLWAAKTQQQAQGKENARNSWFRKALSSAVDFLPDLFGMSLAGYKTGIAPGVAAGTAAAIYGAAAGPFAPASEAIGVPVAFAGGMAAGSTTGLQQYFATGETARAYQEYQDYRDEFGQPIDPNVAKAAALATGQLAASAQAFGPAMLTRGLAKAAGLGDLMGLPLRSAIKTALRQPSVRAALVGMVKSYGGEITALVGSQVAARAVTILGAEMARGLAGPGKVPGQTAPGNVNLYQQPTVQNADGSVSTVDSVSIDVDGKEVLIPRVTPDGRHLTTEEATAEYRKTGQNLGTFDSPASATAFAEQLHNDYAAGVYAKKGPTGSLAEMPGDLAHEFESAALGALFLPLPGVIIHGLRSIAAARRASDNVHFFQALGEGVAASKTGQRLPEALQGFIEHATQDGPIASVFADVDTWTKYWQDKGVDPAAVAAEVTGSRDAYERAKDSGEPLTIPTARYAVKLAGTEHNGFWANELRLGPDEMNAREAELFKEHIAQEADARAPEQQTSAEGVKADVEKQLVAAGFEPHTAETYAGLYEATFGSLADRAGQDALDVYQRYGLRVTRPELPAPAERQVEPATGTLPLTPGVVPSTDDAGQIVTGETPASGTPAAPGESGGSAAAAPADGGAGVPNGEATPGSGKAVTASAAPSPALTRPATPDDVAAAVTAALGTAQMTPGEAGATLPPDGSQLQGTERQRPDHAALGSEHGGVAQPDRPTPGGRAELPGGASESRSPRAVGPGSAGRSQGGAGKGRTVALPAGYEPRFSSLLDGARSLGYTGSDDSLAHAFRERLDKARDYARDLNTLDTDDDAGTTLDLLTAIAKAGGLGIEEEAGSKEYSRRRKGKVLGGGGAYGELETMLESLAKAGRSKQTGKPMPRQFMRSGGLPGVAGIIKRTGGLSADRMREHIAQDPRWAHLQNLSDFLVAVDEAIRVETGTSERPGSASYTVDGILDKVLDVRPDSTWWQEPAPTANNGSGESAASLEAISRTASMKARGEKFVVYDRTGARRPLIGVDAVDYQARPGETYGIEGPTGFRVLDDLGGRAPAPETSNLLHEDAILNADLQGPDGGDITFDISEFDQGLFDALGDDPDAGVDTLATGEKQPRLPGAEHVREQEIVQPAVAEVPFSLTPPPVKGEKRKAAELPPSEEYLAAKAAADDASAALRDATFKYRSREIDDDAYLAARQADDEAQAKFDVAFDRERARGGSTTTLFQDEALTPDVLDNWAHDLKQKTGPDLASFELSLDEHGAIQLESIVVARGAQRAGLGSAVLRELTRFADAHGRRIVLDPSDQLGATSKGRLVNFYKRFGFVQNMGRFHDAEANGAMYRDPSAKATAKGLAVPDAKKLTTSPAFKHWFGKSVVTDDDGQPLRLFHGTTGDFTTFDADRGNIESDFGKGIYFSNTPEDVAENYAGVGPDLTSKIERIVERLEQDEDASQSKTREQLIEEAKQQLGVEHKGATIPVYLKLENPAVLGGDDETILTQDEEYEPLSTFQKDDIKRLRDEGYSSDEIRRELSQESNYDPTVTGTLPDFIDNLQRAANRYQDADTDAIVERLREYGMDGGLSLAKAIDLIRKDETFNYATDDQGDIAANEIIREAIERTGFDGIIDHNVDAKFGSQRRVGKGMAGMDADTVHYIAFKPEQVKSAIGNRGTFSTQDANILHQPERGGRRGFIRFGADRQFNIGLLERADLSTFLHETGHFYLEVFGDLVDQVQAGADQTDTQKQLVADYQTLLTALGAETRADVGEAQHEQLARMFEAYLMEGKAPSVELRSAFARMRAWLVAVYSSLKSLNVQLTDDVRRVFDRMVATDKAIFAAEQEGRVAPMFTTPDAAGMTDTQFGLYRAAVAEAARGSREKLERRVLSEVQREQTAEWKRRQVEIRGQVEKDVYQRPVYQALAAMQKGTKPDGSPLLEETTVEPVKLSRAKLVEQFGAERLQRLPKPFIYTTKGGADPEVVARMFGFTSADDLLTQVERAAPSKQVIDHETSQRMLAEHGSLLLDGSLHEKAREAIATEERETVIRAELRALAHLRTIAAPFVKAGEERVAAEREERAYERRWMDAERKLDVAIAKKEKQVEIDKLREEVKRLRSQARGGAVTIRAAIPPPGVLAEQARLRLATTRVRDLAPAKFWSASRQAAQRALDTAARQDFSGAIVAKQQELINLHLYRQATELREHIEQRVKTIRAQSTSKGLQVLGKAGSGFLEQYQGILERYSFTPASGPALDRRTSLRTWMQEREEAGLPVDLPDDVLDEVRRTPYQNLTTEEFTGVADALDNIAHVAKLENRRLLKEARQTLDSTAEDMATSIRAEFAASGRTPPVVSRDRSEGRLARMVAGYVGAHVRLADWLRQLDGGKDGGVMQMMIGAPINDAGAAEAAMMTSSAEKRGALIEAAYPRSRKRELYVKEKVPAIGQSLSKMERITISVLNWGNEGNRDRIRRSEKWTDAQVDAIRNTLTPEDLAYAQGILDHVNSFKSQIIEKQKRVYGVEPVMVDPTPIQTQHGELAGGYYPLKFDDRLSSNMAAKVDAGAIANLAAYTRATTLRNHLKERLKNVSEPVRRDFSVVDGHLQQVIHDLSHHETLIDVVRLINHPEVRKAIYDTHGDLVHKEILKSIRDIATGTLPPANGVEDAFGWARTGASVAMIGYNLTTPLVHGAGAFPKLLGNRLGVKWAALGLARWARGPEFAETTAKWIDEVSPTMANRRATWNRDLPQLRRDYGVSTGRFSGWVEEAVHHLSFGVVEKQQIVDGYFYLVGKLQQTADTIGFLGAYEKARAGGEPHERATEIADQAVLGIFGGGQVKDLPPVMRGGPYLKMWTVFYGPFNSTFNLLRDSKRAARLSSPASVARLAADVLMYVTVPATLTSAIRGHFSQCDGDALCIAKELGKAHASYLADLLVGTRELSGALQGYKGYEGPAGASFFNDTGKVISQIYSAGAKLADGKPPAEALDDKFWLALDDAAGLAFHYPAGQIRKTIAGIEALEKGDTTNPLAVLFGPPPKAK